MDTDLRELNRNTPYQRIALVSALCHTAKETYVTLSRGLALQKSAAIRVHLRLASSFAILPDRHSLGDVCCGYLISSLFVPFRGYSVFQ